MSLEIFHFAANEVKPSLIRTEADEVTYNLHILLRFELERALMNGDLVVKDSPGAFNDKMSAYLGLTTPPGPRPGGHAGRPLARRAVRRYLPTYTLGVCGPALRHRGAELGPLEGRGSPGAILPPCSHGLGLGFTPRATAWLAAGPGGDG